MTRERDLMSNRSGGGTDTKEVRKGAASTFRKAEWVLSAIGAQTPLVGNKTRGRGEQPERSPYELKSFFSKEV